MTMMATNKIYLVGVEHFPGLSHNLITVVLRNPVLYVTLGLSFIRL